MKTETYQIKTKSGHVIVDEGAAMAWAAKGQPVEPVESVKAGDEAAEVEAAEEAGKPKDKAKSKDK